MDWINKFLELFNSTTKLMKVILYVIALSLATMFLYFAGSMVFGKHVKFLGVEVNIPEAKSDTTFKSIANTNAKLINPTNRHSSVPSEIRRPLTKEGDNSPKTKAVLTTGNNNTIISGSNNKLDQKTHLVNGTNLGVNGDISISSEKEFNSQAQNEFVIFVNELYRNNPYLKKCFMISTTTQSNGGKMASQLHNFLISQGFKSMGSGTVFTQGIQNGISVDVNKQDSCLNIVVGVL